MIKILYYEYSKKTKDDIRYTNPLCEYELQDIDGGIRVIFHFPPQNEFKDESVYNEETGEFENKIKEVILLPECTRSFDIIFTEHKGKIRNIRASRAFEDYTLCYTDRFDFQRIIDFTTNGNRSLGHFPLLNFSISDDMQEVVIYLRNATYKPTYKNAEYVKLESGVWKSYIVQLMEHSDFCKKKIEKYIAKRENIIEWADIYNTVTYLESQVDALTRLVLQLTNKECDETNILKEADKHSVLDIKTIDNIKNEFIEDKANARKRQTNFYTNAIQKNLS